MTLTVGSLFSGIGGLDLGLERAGMRVIWNSEIDPYASRVLKKHWPDVPNIGDITKVNWNGIETPSLICGGYPCQPFSLSGRRRGEDDTRHLWPYFRDAISVLRPRYALLENVRGHLSLGGTRVVGDLAEIGYDAEWQIISAASVGAPHRRDRLFVLAYTDRPNDRTPGHGNHLGKQQTETSGEKRREGLFDRTTGRGPVVANTSGDDEPSEKPYGLQEVFSPKFRKRASEGGPFVNWWQTEPDVGRVANGIPARVDRLRGLGNAVVPQVAEYIGRMVINYDRSISDF